MGKRQWRAGGVSMANDNYACLEDNAGNRVDGQLLGPLLCSTYAGCPNEHLTNMDQLGVACNANGRRSICPGE